MPSDFVYFKQYNISAKQMYENLLALHSVDPCNQDIISVEDIYAITDSLDSLSVSKQAKRSRTPSAETLGDFQWPPQEEEFVIALQEDGWNLGSVQSYIKSRVALVCRLSLLWKPEQKMIKEKHIGSIQMTM